MLQGSSRSDELPTSHNTALDNVDDKSDIMIQYTVIQYVMIQSVMIQHVTLQ